MRALLALAFLALVPTLCLAQQSADWERRVVRCGGTGAPSLREAAGVVAVTRAGTERAARREALRSCMAALGSVLVETDWTVAQALAADTRLAASIEAVVKRVRSASEPRLFSDGGVALWLEVPLDGDISELLLAARSPPAAEAASEGAPRIPVTTGVLVDASRQTLARALAPRVLDEAGVEIYGTSILGPRARRGGTAAYATDVASARRSFAARLGAAPRVVQAVRARGADVVISAADAESIRGSSCLAEGRVVIVAGGRP